MADKETSSWLSTTIASAGMWVVVWKGRMSAIWGSRVAFGALNEGVATGGGASLPGCLLPMVAALVVVALIAVGVYLYDYVPTRSLSSIPGAEENARPSSIPRVVRSGTEGPSDSTHSNSPTGTIVSGEQSKANDFSRLDEGALKNERLQVLLEKGIDEYNRLLQQHRELYAQHHIDPCSGGFFPEGCYAAASTELGKEEGSDNREGARGQGHEETGQQAPRPDLKQPEKWLPTDGERKYAPPKQKGDPEVVRGPEGDPIDIDGNVWEWARDQHGGPHWDVQHPNGQHTNVSPEGKVIGKDNFPNRPR